ncbi:MAG TPA: STAS domain-containing protein [Steroidobacteraceae bacterium]|jgi:anti-sigma B factor antagonist|nr:STAS domain-containing protein [Steroidobacteraceae bacterium]
MKLETSEENDILTVRLEGSLDGKTAPEAREQLQRFLAANSKLILDLSNVDYLSSAGLRLLLVLYRELTARKGKLALLGVSEDIRTVMSHTGFLSFFTLVESAVEAVQAVS